MERRVIDWCKRSYTIRSVNTLIRTAEFDAWLKRLRDAKAVARIIERLRSAQYGNFGDCEPVGNGVSEMRVHVGAGYRMYFTRHGSVTYVLLIGGDKSTQKRDIKRAIQMAKQLKE